MTKIIKKISIMSILLAFFALPHDVFAEQKIAVINMQKVVKQSERGKAATAELEKKFESLKRELQAEQERIRAFKEETEKKAALLSEEARAQKEMEYRKMLRDFKDASENAQFQMKQAEAKVMEPLLKSLEKVVNTIAETHGYTIILESNMPGLYYYSPSIDITNEVIRLYDMEGKTTPGQTDTAPKTQSEPAPKKK